MQLRLRYYALLAEQAGCSEERLESLSPTPAALYAELVERHGFTLRTSSIRPAVNDEFVAWEQPLKDGDCVVFIPPVAGG